jgi:hypothetical protein
MRSIDVDFRDTSVWKNYIKPPLIGVACALVPYLIFAAVVAIPRGMQPDSEYQLVHFRREQCLEENIGPGACPRWDLRSYDGKSSLGGYLGDLRVGQISRPPYRHERVLVGVLPNTISHTSGFISASQLYGW